MQPPHTPLEAIQVVVETEETTLPHMDHVVGGVRSQEAGVEDWDAGIIDGDDVTLDEGGAPLERAQVGRKLNILLSCSAHCCTP